MRRLVMTVVAAIMALAAPASANVITFETAPLGSTVLLPLVEAGFSYENGFGDLSVNALGNPGQDLEGLASGGGVLLVRRAGGGKFRFESIDFAAFDGTGSGTQDLIIAGLADGFLQFDVFTAFNTSAIPYPNWTTEHADVLRGLWLDELYVIVGGGSDPSPFHGAIDNLVLSPDVPEPAGLPLLAAGLVVIGALRRRI